MEDVFKHLFLQSPVAKLCGHFEKLNRGFNVSTVEANNSFKALFDIEDSDFINQNLNKLIKTDKYNNAHAILTQTKKLIESGGGSVKAQVPPHSANWYYVTVNLLPNNFFVCSLFNITNEQRILEESESFFKLIPDLFCVLDSNACFINTNPIWEQITGFKKEVMIGKSFFEFIHPDEYEDTYSKWVDYRDKSAFNTFTNRYRCKNGMYRYFEWRTYHHDDRYFAAARDITRRIEKNQRLERLTAFSNDLLRMSGDKPDLDSILYNLMWLTNSKYCAFNLYNSYNNTYSTVRVVGDTKGIDKIQKILGFKLLGRSWKYNPLEKNQFTDNAVHIYNSFYDFPDFILPKLVKIALQKAFPIGNIATYKISSGQKMIGDVVFITKKGVDFQQSNDLEIYIKQIGLLFYRMEAEEALRSNENLLRQIIDLVPHFIFAKDYQGRFILANKSIAEAYGTNTFDIIGKTDVDFNPVSTQVNHYKKDDREVIKSGKPKYIANEPVRTSSGKTLILQTIKIPFTNPKTNEVSVLGVSTDITERINIENMLRTSEARYRNIVEQAADTILLGTSDGSIVGANDQAEILTLYTKEELCSMKIEDLFTHEVLESVPMRYDLLRRGRTVRNERTLKRKDGSLVPIEMNTRRMPDNSLQSILRDIEEIKRIQKELTDAKEKAEENDRLKSAFLSNMSHEIRTPMNAIVGFSSLLTDPDIAQHKRTYYSEIIENNCNNLLRIIDDVLDISKIESGQLKIIKAPCNINKTLERLYDIVSDSVKKRNIPIEIKYTPLAQELMVFTDETRLMQVLMNLTGNAVNFTAKGLVSFTVEIDGNNLLFMVTDTGCGIENELQQKVFDRFFRTEALRDSRHGGTGLGLTICKSLVEMMGGNIWLESEVNVGTRVFFTIPFDKVLSRQIPVESLKSVPPEFSEFSVLVVEDDKNSMEYLKELLKTFNFGKVVYSDNGIEAVDLAKTHSFDAILMDLQIPGINGLEATRIIKHYKPSTVIIAQTAFAMQNDRETCINAGCDEYITKPLKPGELISALIKTLKV